MKKRQRINFAKKMAKCNQEKKTLESQEFEKALLDALNEDDASSKIILFNGQAYQVPIGEQERRWKIENKKKEKDER